MGIFNVFRRRALPGSIVLPRDKTGSLNWPRCARCKRIVDAYGYENETDTHVEVWAECRGMLCDPKTGQAVPGAPRIHDRMKSSVVVLKGPGWSPNRLTDIIARQAFFAPDGDREFRQDLSADGVAKRWGAG